MEFELDAIQNELVQYYVRNDIRFRKAFFTDFTPQFLRLLVDKAKLNEPNFFSVSGNVRSGKSYSSVTIAILNSALYQKLFSVDYICANKMEFLEKIKDMPEEMTRNSTFLIDEDKSGVFGQGSFAKKMGLQDVQNIVAKYNISTLNLCPTRFSNPDAHYGLKSFGKAVFKNQPVLENGKPNYVGITRFMLYNLQEGSKGGVLPMGMIYIPIFTKLFPKEYAQKLEDDYIQKKDAWIMGEIKGETDILAEMRVKIAKKFAKDKGCMELKKKERFTYISTVLGSGYTNGEIQEIVNLTSLIEKGIIPDD